MITKREFDTIAQYHGLAAAEACAAGLCTHAHYRPPADGPLWQREPMVDLRCPEPMVDPRCPESMGKLLGRTEASTLPAGVVELACGNCSRRYRAAGVACTRVLHRFNLLGELLGTEITP